MSYTKFCALLNEPKLESGMNSSLLNQGSTAAGVSLAGGGGWKGIWNDNKTTKKEPCFKLLMNFISDSYAIKSCHHH